MANVAENLVLDLREQISKKLNRLPLRFFDRNKAGEILSRVTSDLDKITEVLQTGLLKLIVAIGTIVGSLIIMFYYSISLTCIFLVFMLASTIITRIVAKKSLHYASEQQETIGVLTGFVQEYYNGRDVIKAYNHEGQSIRQVEEYQLYGAAGAEDRRGGQYRRGKNHAGQPADAFLRNKWRQNYHRWPEHCADEAQRPAKEFRYGTSGYLAVRRHHRR